MAKKTQASWKDKLNEVNAAATGGDMPWFGGTELETWVAISVKPITMDHSKDAGPDGEWSCIRLMADVEGDGFEEQEIPFWAMEPFLEALDDANDEDAIVEMLYKRKRSGKKNIAHFKVVD